MRIIDIFLKALKERPYLIQPFATATLCAISDILCQYITKDSSLLLRNNNNNNNLNESQSKNDALNKKEPFKLNFKRTLIQCSFGFFITPYSLFQNITVIPYLFPLSIKLRLFKTIMYSTIIMVPPTQFLYFSYVSYWINGKIDTKYIFDRMWKAYFIGFLVWCPFLMYNFTYTAPHNRVLLNNLYSIIWQIYMSFLSFNKQDNDKIKILSLKEDIDEHF